MSTVKIVNLDKDTTTTTTIDNDVASINLQTGDMSVLLINKAILTPFMKKNILLCPVQCHLNDMAMNNVPKI